MILIKRNSIGEAHEEVVKIISERCSEYIRVTEDKEITMDPEEPICIHVDSPFAEPMQARASLFGRGFSQQYQASLYTITERRNDGTDAVYTYGNRLRDYPKADLKYEKEVKNVLKRWIDAIFLRIGYLPIGSAGRIVYRGDGNHGGIDQIQTSIIERLAENPSSRRAVAITWVPISDINRDEPPCLQIVQCLINKDNRLNIICLFRSNDMLSAWGQNAFGLAHLHKFILEGVNERRRSKGVPLIEQGWLETISISAHMYVKRDQLELMKFKEMDKARSAFSAFHKK